MSRLPRKFERADLSRWRQVTLMLGYGPRSMIKLLRILLDYAEEHPDYFRKR